MQRILLSRSLCRRLTNCASISVGAVLTPSHNPCHAFHSSTPALKKGRKRTKFIDPVVVKHVKSKKKAIEVYEDMTIL